MLQPANYFELHNLTLKVTYSSSSFDGKPQLTYKKGNVEKTFRGKDIRVEKTEVGSLLTVTLKSVPDLKTVTFTLLLPLVNVQDNTASVNTRAFETTIRTSIVGPGGVNGQVQTYKFYTLKGTAKQVAF